MPTRRNYWLWYLASVLTLGIAAIVWYYKINKDAKSLAGNKGWSPAISVVAITLGSLLIVPLFVSMWRTWTRVREATNADGMSAGIQFALCFIPIVNLAYYGYLQSKLNAAVERERLPAEAAAVANWGA